MTTGWAERAAAAEHAVLARHLRRVWGLPGTGLGVVGWPPSMPQRMFARWHFWWQAHLLDCLVDAHQRDPTPARADRITRVTRSVHIRNLGRWTGRYYDDMCWLALALDRAAIVEAHPAALRTITRKVLGAWSDAAGGGIPWQRGSDYYNTPANGPAAILLARTGHLGRATATSDWMHRVLQDPDTGLIGDGIVAGSPVDRTVYTYCQGVVIGADVELAKRTGADRARVHRLVAAVAEHLAPRGVLIGHRGGNGGLFTGILARYLALAATGLPGDDPADTRTRQRAATLVLASAEAAWRGRVAVAGLPVFAADWRLAAHVPDKRGAGRTRAGNVTSSADPERDLSVQLSGWMLLEAAASIDRSSTANGDAGG